MVEVYNIETLQEYELVKERGHEPLIDNRFFIIDIVLRVQLQNELFGLATLGKRDIIKANDSFYHWCWDNRKIHVCEECSLPLLKYSAKYISHIMTKGSKAHIAHDPRNFNLLCLKHHNMWDFETEDVKRKMKIYAGNMRRIELIKTDYSKL